MIPTFTTYMHLNNWESRVAKVAQEMSCNLEMASDILKRRIKAQNKHSAAQRTQQLKQQKLERYQQAQSRMFGERED